MLLHKKCCCEFSEWQYLGVFGILSFRVHPFSEHILNFCMLFWTQYAVACTDNMGQPFCRQAEY